MRGAIFCALLCGLLHSTAFANSSSTDTPDQTTSQDSSFTDTSDQTTSQDANGSTLMTTTSKPANYCEIMPCGTKVASCIRIKDGRICRCPFGYYYANTTKLCSQGKQFFWNVELNTTYSTEFENPASENYTDLYNNVNVFFRNSFANRADYAETVIAKIIDLRTGTGPWKSMGTAIEAIIIFILSSNITESVLREAIKAELEKDPLFLNFTKSTPCNVPYCDETTTVCKSSQNDTIATCECQTNFYRRPLETTTCTACATNCTAKQSKECVLIEDKKDKNRLVPDCQCMAGFTFDKEEINCVACSIGYSGENCEDDFLFILIIVGSISGALVLALLGGVIGLSFKAKKNKKLLDRERLLQHEEKPVFSSTASTNDAHFPRVQVKPTVNTNNATSFPYTANEPFPRTLPTRDYDDDNDSWFAMSQKQNKPGNNSKY